MSKSSALLLLLWTGTLSAVDLRLSGDFSVSVTLPNRPPVTLAIPGPDILTVTNERHDKLPGFDPKAAPWRKGLRLNGVIAEECTVQGALDPESLMVRSGPDPSSATTYRRGEDYDADLAAGTLGRLPSGRIPPDQPVFLSYRYAQQRLDSIVQTNSGAIFLKPGTPHAVLPAPPPIESGETRLANVFLNGRITALGADSLFPILETAYPEPPVGATSIAEQRLPKTIAKLQSGQRLKILAWGDSVSTYNRYQSMFVDRLRQRFPQADIELVTEAWGGRNTGSYLKEPPGSEHNYQEKVLAQ